MVQSFNMDFLWLCELEYYCNCRKKQKSLELRSIHMFWLIYHNIVSCSYQYNNLRYLHTLLHLEDEPIYNKIEDLEVITSWILS